MGANAKLVDYEGAVPVGPKRTALVQKVQDALMVVLGLQEGDEEAKAVAASTIIQHLRDILGISELTTLRRRALDQALAATGDQVEREA